jgi:hypothetical protein
VHLNGSAFHHGEVEFGTGGDAAFVVFDSRAAA